MNIGTIKKLNCNYSNISGSHTTINKIKNDYSKRNTRKLLNDDEYNYCFINNRNIIT